MDAPKTKTYIIKEKRRLFHNSKNYTFGDKVELTEAQAKQYSHFIESPKSASNRVKDKINSGLKTAKERVQAKRKIREDRTKASEALRKKQKAAKKKQTTGARNKQVNGEGQSQLNRGQQQST